MHVYTFSKHNTSHDKGYSLAQARACILLGFCHALLLGLGIYALIACCAGLTGADYARVLSLGLSLLVINMLSWHLLHRLHSMLLYLGIGAGASILLASLSRLIARDYGGVRSALSLATFFLCMAIVVIHAQARARHGEIKADFLATHEADVPFRMELWEVPTLITHPSLWCMLWFAVQYAVGLIAKFPLYWHTIFYLALLDLFVCFAFHYIHQFTIFLQDNHTSANLPVRTIRRVHLILLVVGTLLLLLFTAPAVLYNREPLSEVTLTISNLPSMDSGDTSDFMPAPTDMENPFMQELIDTGIVHEPPEWLTRLMNVLLILIFAGLAVGVLFAVIQAVRYAMKNFAIRDEDEVIFLEDETADTTEAAVPEITRDDGFFSTNRQIRRRYKRTIRKATKGIPDCWASPSELEAACGLSGTDEMKVLHESYEKARYSRGGAGRKES